MVQVGVSVPKDHSWSIRVRSIPKQARPHCWGCLEPVNSSRIDNLETVNYHFILSVLFWSAHLQKKPQPKAWVDMAVRQEKGLSPVPLTWALFWHLKDSKLPPPEAQLDLHPAPFRVGAAVCQPRDLLNIPWSRAWIPSSVQGLGIPPCQ